MQPVKQVLEPIRASIQPLMQPVKQVLEPVRASIQPLMQPVKQVLEPVRASIQPNVGISKQAPVNSTYNISLNLNITGTVQKSEAKQIASELEKHIREVLKKIDNERYRRAY